MSKKQQAIDLWNAGHRNHAEIARQVGVCKQMVGEYLGSKVDAEKWESDRIRHAEFFNGLSPAQEYAQHFQQRNELCELHDERF
jgi:hypothetical protein